MTGEATIESTFCFVDIAGCTALTHTRSEPAADSSPAAAGCTLAGSARRRRLDAGDGRRSA
jgi:hypothetical protein